MYPLYPIHNICCPPKLSPGAHLSSAQLEATTGSFSWVPWGSSPLAADDCVSVWHHGIQAARFAALSKAKCEVKNQFQKTGKGKGGKGKKNTQKKKEKRCSGLTPHTCRCALRPPPTAPASRHNPILLRPWRLVPGPKGKWAVCSSETSSLINNDENSLIKILNGNRSLNQRMPALLETVTNMLKRRFKLKALKSTFWKTQKPGEFQRTRKTPKSELCTVHSSLPNRWLRTNLAPQANCQWENATGCCRSIVSIVSIIWSLEKTPRPQLNRGRFSYIPGQQYSTIIEPVIACHETASAAWHTCPGHLWRFSHTVHTSHVSDVCCKMVQSSKAKGTVLKDQLRLVDFVCPQGKASKALNHWKWMSRQKGIYVVLRGTTW